MNALGCRLTAVLLWSAAMAPLGRWWYRRLAEPLDAGLLAAASLVVLVGCAWYSSRALRALLPGWKIILAAAGLLLFGLLRPYLPLTLAAVPAVLASLPLVLPEDVPQGPVPLPLAALAFLSLPSLLILDLFLGVPLRALAVSGASVLLKIGGFDVVQRGFELVVDGQPIWVDAPCAGVRMLATGAWLACVLAQANHLNVRRTLCLGGLSLVLLVVSNTMRVTVLTAAEALGHHLADTPHALVGLAALVPGVVAMALAAAGLARGQHPPAPPRPRGQSLSSRGQSRTILRGPVPMLVLALAAAVCCTLHTRKGTDPFKNTATFPGWPTTFEGQTLKESPLAERELSFSKDFPGRIGNFTTDQAQVILRWTDRPTPRVHSASACLTASGWQLTPLPLVRRTDGDWSAFRATRGGQTLVVREQVQAADGSTLSDIPTWFIQALRGKTPGPWWIVTVAEAIVPR